MRDHDGRTSGRASNVITDSKGTRCGTTMDGAAESVANGSKPGRPRGDTRERIQAVALELFAEQGYEKTSLREIAERLGVTKAALYYHFKSKEDIVRSFTEDYARELDALIAWGRDQPRTEESRAALLARYSDIVEPPPGGAPLPGAEPGRGAPPDDRARGPGPEEAFPPAVRDAARPARPAGRDAARPGPGLHGRRLGRAVLHAVQERRRRSGRTPRDRAGHRLRTRRAAGPASRD